MSKAVCQEKPVRTFAFEDTLAQQQEFDMPGRAAGPCRQQQHGLALYLLILLGTPRYQKQQPSFPGSCL
eukprot:1150130-Pelagomonas_calceolata.AAC.5